MGRTRSSREYLLEIKLKGGKTHIADHNRFDPHLVEATGLSFPAVSSAMELLVQLGLARELTGRRRNRLFAYHPYLSILNEGTERP